MTDKYASLDTAADFRDFEKEIADLKVKIDALHIELADLYDSKADLRDEMRQMEKDMAREINREINDAYQRGYNEGYNDGYDEAAGR